MRAFLRANVLAAILLGVMAAVPGGAAVFVVNTVNDSPDGGGTNCDPFDRNSPPTNLPPTACSLRDALDAANDSNGADEIVFDVPIGSTILVNTTLELLDDDGVSINAPPLAGVGQQLLSGLTIQGPAADDALVFQIDEGNAEFRNLTISRGNVLVADVASVVFEQTAGSVTFAQDVSGDGVFEKEGAGTVILTGTNDFTGGIEIGQGTLQGDTLSIPGGTALDPFEVEDDGALVFDQDPDEQGPDPDDLLPEDFFGEISGTGRLELIGGGILHLQSANTYTGGTTITNGTLIGFAGPGASLQGDIVNNDELVFLQAADATFDDDITGSGRVTKQGDGTLTLTGENGFGSLAIQQGEVLIGDPDSMPAQSDVSISAPAQLIFDHDANDALAGDLSGVGDLVKRGTGTLSLTGSNAGFTGDMLVEEGALEGNTESLQTDIALTAGADLIFSQDFDGTFAGTITGTGSLIKRGGGSLTFDEDQGFTPDADTQVEAGRLVIDALFPGNVDVGSSATLAGVGSVSGLVTIGGRISPGPVGGPFGTLQVGSVDFLSSAVFEVQVDDGSGDLLAVGNTATIQPGAVLDVTFPELEPGVSFSQDVLTAPGGVTGTFADIEQQLCFFTARPESGANAVTIVVEADADPRLVDCASTSNQRAVAGALDEAFQADPHDSDLDTVFARLGPLPVDEAADALDEMSGEQLTEFATTRLAIGDRMMARLHERIRGVAWGDSEALLSQQMQDAGTPVFASDAVLQRVLPGVVQGFAPSGAFPTWLGAQSMSSVLDSGTSVQPLQGEHGLGGWIDGYGLFGALDGDSDNADLDYTIGGFSLGVDYLVAKRVLVGAAGGYAYSTLDFDGLSGDFTSNTGQGALYAGYVLPWLRVGASGRFGYSAMETRRDIDIMGRSADADFSGWDVGVRTEAALDLFEISFVEIQPLASFSYTHLEQDSFDESGADSLDLDVDEQTIDSVVSGLGARFHGLLQMDEDLWFHPELHATWLHEFGDTERELDARIGGTSGSVFTVQGEEPSPDVGVFGVRWTVVSAGTLHVFADYDVSLSSALLQHGVSAGFKVVW